MSDKKYSDTRLDVLSALVLAETVLNGPGKCWFDGYMVVHQVNVEIIQVIGRKYMIKMKCS